jgi:hypothetical protein
MIPCNRSMAIEWQGEVRAIRLPDMACEGESLRPAASSAAKPELPIDPREGEMIIRVQVPGSSRWSVVGPCGRAAYDILAKIRECRLELSKPSRLPSGQLSVPGIRVVAVVPDACSTGVGAPAEENREGNLG